LSDEFGWRVTSSVDECKEVDIDEMIDKMGTELVGAAGRERLGVGRMCGSMRKGIRESGRC